MFGDPDVDFTKCHECGRWDEAHHFECITGLRAAYVEGRIELDEFETKIGEALEGDGEYRSGVRFFVRDGFISAPPPRAGQVGVDVGSLNPTKVKT